MNNKLAYENETYKKPTIMFSLIILSYLLFRLITNFSSLTLICFLVCFAYILTLIIIPRHIKKHHELIVQTGKRFSATVTGYQCRRLDSGTIYTVSIRYIDPFTFQEKNYKTPPLNFNPKNKLGSRECSVYIKDNEIYVSDFVERRKGENVIWTSEEMAQEDYKKDLEQSLVLGIFLILFIVSSILVLFFI